MSVHDVTTPPPTVMVPEVSVPITAGELPQVPIDGVVPDEIIWPLFCTPNPIVPLVDETVRRKSVGLTAGAEGTERRATPVADVEIRSVLAELALMRVMVDARIPWLTTSPAIPATVVLLAAKVVILFCLAAAVVAKDPALVVTSPVKAGNLPAAKTPVA